MRLVRTGTTVQAFKSSDGVTWTQVGSNVTVSMTNPVLVGLAVTSGTTSSTKQSLFDNVTIIQTGVTGAASATPAANPRRRDHHGANAALRFMYVLLSRNFTITAR